MIVTSSNYPRFDRNPNNGDDFYTTADSSVTALNTVHLGPGTFLDIPALQ